MFVLSIFSSELLCVFPDYSQYFILKVALPSLFLVYLWYFSNKQCNFTTNKCEKIIHQYAVLGFEPFEHESPSITTRPGAGHIKKYILGYIIF